MRENATSIVYRGSNVEVPEPEIRLNSFDKDFGYGFYCTDFERQAQRWSLTRRPLACGVLGVGEIQVSNAPDCLL